MAGAPVSDWLDRHSRSAPAALLERVRFHIAAVERRGSEAEVLARASHHALHLVAAHPDMGRSVALDLLAADALITLALLHQAEAAPAGLEAFAAALLQVPSAA